MTAEEIDRLVELEHNAALATWGTVSKRAREVRLKRDHWNLGSNATGMGIGIIFGSDDTDAQFVAALRNAAPRLLSIAQAAREYVEASDRLFGPAGPNPTDNQQIRAAYAKLKEAVGPTMPHAAPDPPPTPDTTQPNPA